jgi:hypothetical protein
MESSADGRSEELRRCRSAMEVCRFALGANMFWPNAALKRREEGSILAGEGSPYED